MQKRDELMQIAIDLKNWAKKYNKNYVTMCVINDNTYANIDPDDKDYKYLNISIFSENTETKNVIHNGQIDR